MLSVKKESSGLQRTKMTLQTKLAGFGPSILLDLLPTNSLSVLLSDILLLLPTENKSPGALL